MSEEPAQALILRPPHLSDGGKVAQLVREVGELEPNTVYAYLLLCHHFSSTCVVAEREGAIVGCALAYRLPEDASRLFVWQIGVAQSARGQGLALSMLEHLFDRKELGDVMYVEQTIAPSNVASNRLFDSFARRRGLNIQRSPGFRAEDFEPFSHEEELLVSIGPRPAV